MPDSRRPLRTITADEWVRWQWIDVTRMDDEERMFVPLGYSDSR
jgi:hypothetical protein